MKTQTDLDISTKVRHNGQTGVLIYNRCRQGNQVVAVEFDNDLFPVQLVNVNDLEIKFESEQWVKVSELGKRR